jgi:hypothetical protein
MLYDVKRGSFSNMIPSHTPECINNACLFEKYNCSYPCILEGGYGRIQYPFGQSNRLQRVWVNSLGVVIAHEIKVIDAIPHWWVNYSEATGKQSFLMHKCIQNITTLNARQFYFEYHVCRNNTQASRVRVIRMPM